ncbi:endonuclease NucS domain-containing protein [Haladaptatus sp. DYSN1]|uniref:endonuclease NucS domain-containing protein n=1 Tax=unclassified Haladaptatus TaxID=2622732 RepID=UPI002405E92C|nr:endonuclease NucS domain-containing protein [Haladaptatus sp. DYSN1]
MLDSIRVLAGDCTIIFEGTREQTARGHVVVIAKPDNTLLVHDADGYQPVAWLTRADALSMSDTAIIAQDGDQLLTVTVHDEYTATSVPAAKAGTPVGTCPECDGTLVKTRTHVSCLGCEAQYGLPQHAAILDEQCADCGLPKMRATHGKAFELCIDRSCDSLDERIKAEFDGEWQCPECDGNLNILRRGSLIAGCENYPDCETGFAFPTGTHAGNCPCGLPQFETASGHRCLDATCDAV